MYCKQMPDNAECKECFHSPLHGHQQSDQFSGPPGPSFGPNVSSLYITKNNLSYMIAKIILRMIDAKIIFVKWDMVMTVHLQPIPISLKGLKGMFAKAKL